MVDALVDYLPWGVRHGVRAGEQSTAIGRVFGVLARGGQPATRAERSAAASLAHLAERIADYRKLEAPHRFAAKVADVVAREEGLSL